VAPLTRRGILPIDRLSLGFIVLFAAILMVQARQVAAWPWLLLGDGLVVLLVLLLPRLPAEGLFASVVGGAYPLILASAFYWQLGAIQQDVGRLYDPLVQRWELALFGAQVSTTWHRDAPYPLLSAALHLCYGAYYWILALVPTWLLIRGKRAAFQRAVFCSALALYVCYLVFGIFPVAGPYFAFPAPTGPVVDNWPARYVYFMLGTGSSMGTAFPSSHIAAAWVTVYAAWRDERRLALALAPVAVGLALGTVYGQFHYAVDAMAGALLAVALMAGADPLRVALGARREP
jgi:membrane-associated phospholipid phosphatase